jgi:hypothetical protein
MPKRANAQNAVVGEEDAAPYCEGTATRDLTGCQRPFAFPGTAGVAGPEPRGSAGCAG